MQRLHRGRTPKLNPWLAAKPACVSVIVELADAATGPTAAGRHKLKRHSK